MSLWTGLVCNSNINMDECEGALSAQALVDSNSDMSPPCGTPPPLAMGATSGSSRVMGTAVACAGPYTRAQQPGAAESILPVSSSPTCHLPTTQPLPPPPPYQSRDDDTSYHPLPDLTHLTPITAVPCRTPGVIAAAPAAGASDTHHLLPHLPPQYTEYHAATPSSSSHTTPAAAPPYTHGDVQHTIYPTTEHACPRYTLAVSHAGDIVREDCYGPAGRGGGGCIYGHPGGQHDCEQQFIRHGPVGGGSAMGGVCVVRRWACTGVLLVVGALPWIIAMATFIKQRNSALAGLLGLVVVFFMVVVLGRIIRRVQEAGWLQRQERRRRQYCNHNCSSQMLMSESPPAYEVVVKSPPPYSISCGGPRPIQAYPTNSPPAMTLPVPHLQNQAETVQSTEGVTLLAHLPIESVDTRRSTGHDDVDSSLPSYDEAIQQWAT